MKLRILLLLGAVLAAGAQPALAMGNPSIAPFQYYTGYTPTILGHAAAQGGMLTRVMGNPFEQTDKARLDEEITRIMTRSHFGPEVAFVTTAPEGYTSPYRVVVLFDPVQTINAYKACGYTEDQPATRSDGVVRAHLVLCANEKPLTAVSGQVRGVNAPSDPLFRKLIGQMSIMLFPTRRPDDSDHRGEMFFP